MIILFKVLKILRSMASFPDRYMCVLFYNFYADVAEIWNVDNVPNGFEYGNIISLHSRKCSNILGSISYSIPWKQNLIDLSKLTQH